MRPPSRPLPGLAAILLALLFNMPYAILAATFDYPDILRRPAGEVLDAFAASGAGLILTWHAFALAALALVPLALALSLTPERLALAPGLAVSAAILGALAGLTQAIGLVRWVFVIPQLAAAHANPAAQPGVRPAAEALFDLLNAYGGVAIGEHLGQLLTALFVLTLARVQWREGARRTAATGFATAAAIAFGTTEGLALALGQPGDLFSAFTIAGFLGLTLWLILTGVGHLRGRRAVAHP
jgi:hypothetical protein